MRYLVFAALLLSGLRLPAQPGIPVFKQVTNPFMPAITSDYFFFSADGLMWFSTARGLTSFDGSDIAYHSSPEESNRYGLARIFAIAEDRDRNFWIGTPNGLFHFNRENGRLTAFSYQYRDNGKLSNLGFDALYIDGSGLIYAGTGNGGMFVIDPASGRTRHFNLDTTMPDSWNDRRYNTVCSFAPHFSDSNKLWVGTFHGIFLFDKQKNLLSQDFEIVTPTRHRYYPFFGDKQMIDVGRMEPEGDSVIWFNSWAGGFGRYNTRTGSAEILFGRNGLYEEKDVYYGYIIPGFARLPDHRFLMGIHNGKTAVYDPGTGAAAFFNVANKAYAEEETRYVTTDPNGNIWMLQRGLLYVTVPSGRWMTSLPIGNNTNYSFSRPKLRGVFFDTTAKLFYFGFLSSAGVHVYDTAFRLVKVIPSTVINNYYNFGSTVDSKLAKDGSGRVWVIGWKNHVLLPGSNRFKIVEKVFPALKWMAGENLFDDITATRAGDILLRSQNGNVYRINQHTLVADTIACPKVPGDPTGITPASAWYDPSRDLVYLSGNGCLAQYDLRTQLMRLIPGSSLFGSGRSGPGVGFPTLDAGGRLWLTIPKYGIRIIDPESLQCVDSVNFGEKGLVRADVTAAFGGPGNSMVFHTQNGIVVYDFTKQQSFLIDQSNGLSSPDNKSFLVSNGYLFVGQGSSLVEYFKLSNLEDYQSTVIPYLTFIRSDTQYVYNRTGAGNEDVIRLNHRQNTLTFSFSAHEFLFPERIEYAYKLTPVEDTWHYTNFSNRRIIYTNLGVGQYVFHLKSQFQGGNWEGVPVTYTLVIAPAWWQTSWFRVVAAVLIAGFAIWLIQLRIRYIKGKEKERLGHEKAMMELEAKALRAQMNPHFIFNSLNSIKSLINKGSNDKAAAYLTTFSKLIRTLFQNSDRREISLYEEIDTCRLYAELEKMRFGDKVQFSFDIDENLDLKDIRVPALIVQPFIENAIWHGLVPKEEGGSIRVSVQGNQDKVVCTIDDDGIGRELSARYKAEYRATHESRGIGLTQSRLELDRILSEREDAVEVIDKHDPDGRATGTTVIITFAETK